MPGTPPWQTRRCRERDSSRPAQAETRPPIWCSGTSPRPPPISSGWRISPMSRPGRASSACHRAGCVESPGRGVGHGHASQDRSGGGGAEHGHHPTAPARRHSPLEPRCHYTALAFENRGEQLGLRLSRGTVGDAYDNAMAENFFATLECERIDRRIYHTPTEARLDLGLASRAQHMSCGRGVRRSRHDLSGSRTGGAGDASVPAVDGTIWLIGGSCSPSAASIAARSRCWF